MPKIIRKRSLRSACEWWAKCLEDRFTKKSYGVYKRLVTIIATNIDEDWNVIDCAIERDLKQTIKNLNKLGYEVY